MTTLRVKPIDTAAPGSFRERMRILRVFQQIRSDDTDFITGQLLLDELLASRLETDDGSDLDAALDLLTAEEADGLVKRLLVSEPVPTQSAGS